MAAGVDPAPARPGRPLRLRLPGPADLRRPGARRAVRARPPTSPTCTPGPRCTSPAPAGSGWTRPRACSPARATSRCRPPRIPASAAPITGATEPCETTLDFSNVVTRVHEDPRVTLPYTDAAWGAIVALGARVDERLAAGDVRLTMGGEPTFVSIDNQVDPEWTTDADGPHKRERASALAARLKKVWAPQGLVQRSQGKWYPGEPLPRWQIGLHLAHRRRAAVDRRRRCWPTRGRPKPPDAIADPTPAGRLLGAIADGPRAAGHPGAARLRGRAEPAGRRGAAARGRTGRRRGRPGRRRRRRPRGTAGPARRPVTEPAAYVLPLHRRDDDAGLGQRRLAAAPRPHRAADGRFAGRAAAAAGLDQLAAAARRRIEADPLAPSAASCRSSGPSRDDAAVEVEDAEAAPITAMVAEVRDGAALRLPAADRGARALRRPRSPGSRPPPPRSNCPVVIEGYGPPTDPRLQSMSRHPRPRRHRGQRRAHGQLRRAARSSSRPSTSRPGWRGCPPSRSTSTAPTAAPAAATTSPSAASPPPTRRCCAGPTCWCRC